MIGIDSNWVVVKYVGMKTLEIMRYFNMIYAMSKSIEFLPLTNTRHISYLWHREKDYYDIAY